MVAPVNGARGEVAVSLAGEPARLCLTLGALAEMETALGVAEGGSLAERLRTVSAREVAIVLAALLRGGGMDEQDAARLSARASPREAAQAVQAGFAAVAGD